MPDAALPDAMPAGFTPQAGWKGLHTQRARADQAQTALKAARGELETARAAVTKANAAAKDVAMDSYLRGKGAKVSSRARRALARTFAEDTAGAETPMAFHEWIEQDDVKGDPFVQGMLGGQTLTAPAAPAKKAAAPNVAARQVPGGTVEPTDLTKLTPAQIGQMVNTGQIKWDDYVRQMAAAKG